MRLLSAIAFIVLCVSASAATEKPASPAFVRTVMPSGLTVIVKQEPGTGIAAIEVLIKAGVEQERDFNSGIGSLVARTILAGTRNKRAETVAGVIEGVGGNMVTEWDPDYTEIKAVTTASGFDETVSLLGDIMNNANFQPTWVERARKDALAEASSDNDDVFQTTYQQLREKLYSENPYHRPLKGSPRAIRNLTADDLMSFYNQYYVPNNIVVSVVGDVTPEHARDRFRMAFAGANRKDLPKTRPVLPEKLTCSAGTVSEKPIQAAYFMFGFLAPGIGAADYPAAQVASAALGSGKGSRMFQVLREQKGLAYEVGTLYPPLKNQSHIIAYLITDPYRRVGKGFSMQMLLTEVKQAMLEEVTRMQKDMLTPEELERAKRYTIGSYALRHQRLRDRAFHLGWLEAIGVGCEYDTAFESKIEAVTAADVRKVAKKCFNNYAMTIVLPDGEDSK